MGHSHVSCWYWLSAGNSAGDIDSSASILFLVVVHVVWTSKRMDVEDAHSFKAWAWKSLDVTSDVFPLPKPVSSAIQFQEGKPYLLTWG